MQPGASETYCRPTAFHPRSEEQLEMFQFTFTIRRILGVQILIAVYYLIY